MLFPTVNLDAYMSASDALARLARHGLWLPPPNAAARAWIEENAAESGIAFDDIAAMLARDPKGFRVAIRRQWHSNILWYSRSALEVLAQCGAANPATSVLDALGLHEPDSRPPVKVGDRGVPPGAEGVVLVGSTPIAVSDTAPKPEPARQERGIGSALTFRRKPITLGGAQAAKPVSRNVSASVPLGDLGGTDRQMHRRNERAISGFPRIEAPDYVPAEEQFTVRVGLGKERSVGVAGAPVVVPVPAGKIVVEVDIELIADGLVTEAGWSRKLSLDVNDPTRASVEFKLRGKRLENREKMHLTTLEVRYVFEGAVCGFATRPLVIGPADVPAAKAPRPQPFGTPWNEQHRVDSPIAIAADPDAPDLTIEILQPDRDGTAGHYVCWLYSRHKLKTKRGPHEMRLGSDAKTFAKETVEKMRILTGKKTLADMVRSRGRVIAGRLPPQAFAALREVAKKVHPQQPTVLIVSAEQFVPWELAEVDPPLDPTRPGVLGAQATVGRWLRDEEQSSPPRPPLRPPAALRVPSLAVMIGHYATGVGGWRPLPYAEMEAGVMKDVYGAVVVDATDDGLHQLISANVPPIGSPGAIHFAGHGEYDPSRVDSSVMLLSDGTEMDSMVFGGAKYGDKSQPLIFMNACTIGIGGEVLGASGGFPGNCLRGGFGAFVGAIWEVNDRLAHDVALEFWKRALPLDGSEGEPVGAIIGDVRTRYVPPGDALPIPTYLAYVYYGHPRLRLRRPT